MWKKRVNNWVWGKTTGFEGPLEFGQLKQFNEEKERKGTVWFGLGTNVDI